MPSNPLLTQIQSFIFIGDEIEARPEQTVDGLQASVSSVFFLPS